MIGWLVRGAAIVLAGTMTVVMVQGAEDPPLFTAQQAAQGKALYAARCATCHGGTLQGGSAGPLAGAAFAAAWTFGGTTWTDYQPTVDDLDFIIRTTMPKGAAGSMSAEEYTAVLAYILQQNGYPAGPTPLRAGSGRMKRARLRFGIPKELAAAPPPLRIVGDAAAVPKGGGPTQEELNRAADSTRDWLYHTHDYSGARYVALDQIDNRNADQLRPGCFRWATRETFRRALLYTRGQYTSQRRGGRWHLTRSTAGLSGDTHGCRTTTKCGGTTEGWQSRMVIWCGEHRTDTWWH
jgi:mono/diheme cytochrome c family protein